MFDMKRKAGDAIPDLLSYNKEKVFSSRYFVTLGSMIIHVGQNWKWISSEFFPGNSAKFWQTSYNCFP